MNAALERLHAAGIEAEAMLGDVDPACAVIEVWDPRRWDEVLVSTLPTGTSRWLRVDLPHRIARAVDAAGQPRRVPPGPGARLGLARRRRAQDTSPTSRVLRRRVDARQRGRQRAALGDDDARRLRTGSPRCRRGCASASARGRGRAR